MTSLFSTTTKRIALCIALVALGSFSAGSAAAATIAEPPSRMYASFTFTELVPGTTQVQTKEFSLPLDAIVTGVAPFSSTTSDPDFVWSAEVCGASGCQAVDTDFNGARLAAGTHSLRVSVQLNRLGGVPSSSVLARLSFVDAAAGDDLLAATGLDAGRWIAGSTAVAAIGILFFLLARRRREVHE